MTYWLSEAAATLRGQVDKRWPDRDKASDGWIGDASHQAVASDHNPDYTSTPPGVVRAIDIDVDLDPKDSTAAPKLANELIKYARDRKDNGRLSYVIYNRQIASGTYADTFWTWRAYSGSDPHTSHIHVSFKPKGDHRGGEFHLGVFGGTRKSRVVAALKNTLLTLNNKIRALVKKRAAAKRRLENLK